MFKVVDVEGTPNPDALKFNLNEAILDQGVRQFDQKTGPQNDNVATPIFSLDGVESVFYMDRFVTVSKKSDADWDKLKIQIIHALESPDVVPQTAKKNQGSVSGSKSASGPETDDPALLQEVEAVIDANVRPALAGDGGGLDLVKLEKFTLSISYQGACGSCPSAAAGTMAAVQNLLQRMVDPRLKVVSV